jgi:hypothetical protein
MFARRDVRAILCVLLVAGPLLIASAVASSIRPLGASSASISGSVFDDLNGNGVRNAGEPGLAGVVIQFDQGADGSVDATATTDVNGNYFFGSNSATYRVRQVVPAGRVQTTANPADINGAVGASGVDFGSIVAPPTPTLDPKLLILLAVVLASLAAVLLR